MIKNNIYKAKYTITSNPGKALLLTKNAMLINAGPRIHKNSKYSIRIYYKKNE